ncbi:MAG: dihydrolipoamide acetyltransferase family protein [Terriglobia bacterium]
MAEITMPKLSDTMTEGVVVRWHKKPGEAVVVGDVLAEIETDKATMEMEAFDDGVLKAIFAEEGQKVAVGERIALIEAENAGQPPKPADQPVSSPPPKKVATAVPSPAPPSLAKAPAVSEKPVEMGRIKISPLARKTASQMNVPVEQLQGSGPGGRIIQEDVFQAAKRKEDSAGEGQPATGGLIPLTAMRRVIAQRMVESKTRIPHFYLDAELDAGPLLQLRGLTNEALAAEGAPKLSVNDFVLKATVECLKRVPQVNASFTDNGILQYAQVHLGFAVSLEDGLITPVIRNAETKQLRQLSLEARELIEKARTKKLKPAEYQGGTFTISNLGASGIESFHAIINPPQAAILAVGSIVKKPVVNAQDQIVVGHRLTVALCCDHRVVDGAVGAIFLQEFRKLIENPALMLIQI